MNREQQEGSGGAGGPGAPQDEAGNARSTHPGTFPLSEWIIGGLGGLLVLFAVGFLICRAAMQRDSPPDLAVSVMEVVPSQGGYLVRVQVVNTGGATAAH